MPTRSVHTPEANGAVDLLRILVLAAVGIMAVLAGDPRLMGDMRLGPQQMSYIAFGMAGSWLVVDLVEKFRFRQSRPPTTASAATASAATIVHRPGELSRAVFPMAVGGIAAVLLATPLATAFDSLGDRLLGNDDKGSLAWILVAAGLAIGVAKLVTVARYGLRSRVLKLTPEALIVDGHRLRTIAWREIRDARLVLVRSRRRHVPYLALALEDPARHQLRPTSLWRRLTSSGALAGDTLVTNLDIFLDRPENIVEDVRRFIRLHHDPGGD